MPMEEGEKKVLNEPKRLTHHCWVAVADVVVVMKMELWMNGCKYFVSWISARDEELSHA